MASTLSTETALRAQQDTSTAVLSDIEVNQELVAWQNAWNQLWGVVVNCTTAVQSGAPQTEDQPFSQQDIMFDYLLGGHRGMFSGERAEQLKKDAMWSGRAEVAQEQVPGLAQQLAAALTKLLQKTQGSPGASQSTQEQSTAGYLMQRRSTDPVANFPRPDDTAHPAVDGQHTVDKAAKPRAAVPHLNLKQGLSRLEQPTESSSRKVVQKREGHQQPLKARQGKGASLPAVQAASGNKSSGPAVLKPLNSGRRSSADKLLRALQEDRPELGTVLRVVRTCVEQEQRLAGDERSSEPGSARHRNHAGGVAPAARSRALQVLKRQIDILSSGLEGRLAGRGSDGGAPLPEEDDEADVMVHVGLDALGAAARTAGGRVGLDEAMRQMRDEMRQLRNMVAASGAATGANVARLSAAAESLSRHARAHSSTVASSLATAHAGISRAMEMYGQRLQAHGDVATGLQLLSASLQSTLTDQASALDKSRVQSTCQQLAAACVELKTATAALSHAHVDVDREAHVFNSLLSAQSDALTAIAATEPKDAAAGIILTRDDSFLAGVKVLQSGGGAAASTAAPGSDGAWDAGDDSDIPLDQLEEVVYAIVQLKEDYARLQKEVGYALGVKGKLPGVLATGVKVPVVLTGDVDAVAQ